MKPLPGDTPSIEIAILFTLVGYIILNIVSIVSNTDFISPYKSKITTV